MAERIPMDRFKSANGFLDWAAYKRAKRDNGEYCKRCDGMTSILCDPPGHPTTCGSCNALEQDEEEVTHDNYIRCPACGNLDKVSDWDCDFGKEKYTEGRHTVSCGECEHEYEISTHVSYCYTSPPRCKDEEEKG